MAGIRRPSGIAPADVEEPKVEVLLVEVLYGSLRLNTSLVAYQDEQGRRYLPLRELARVLDFHLYVNEKAQTVRGFLASPNDRLELSAETGRYKRSGVSGAFSPTACFAKDSDLYVDSGLLHDVAGLGFEWRMLKLEVVVSSDRPLTARRQRFAEAPASERVVEAPLGLIETPYRAWTPPAFDIQLSTSTSNLKDEGRQRSTLFFNGVGDLAFMTARYRFGSGSDGYPLARLSLEREDSRGKLLGFMRAKRVEFGDLALPSVPLLTRGRNALGISVSDFPTAANDPSSVETIEGRAPAGDRVELYRDNVRIDALVADENGRFVFSGIRLDGGPNTFRVVMISLDGTIIEQERVLYGNAVGPKPGESRYRLTASQVSGSLFPTKAYAYQRNGRELLGELGFGLTSASWLSTSVSSIEGEGVQRQYLGLGFHNWTGGFQWHVDGMTNGAAANAVTLGVAKKLARGFVSVEHTRLGGDFNGLILPESLSDATAVTKIRLDGLKSFGRRSIAYGLSLDNYEGTNPSSFLRARVSGGSGDLFVSNSLFARVSDGPVDANGLLQLRRRFGSSSLRLDLGYGLSGDAGGDLGLRTTRLTLDRRVSADYRIQMGGAYDKSRDRPLEAIGNVYRMFGPMALGLGFSVDQRGGAKVSLLFNVGGVAGSSFGETRFARPGAGDRATVLVRVFLDKNLSGKFDKGDVLLPGAGVLVGGHASARTDASGICTLSQIEPNQEVSIRLNENTFDDPFWIAGKRGVAVRLHPGATLRADLAVIESAQIEGKVTGNVVVAGLTAELVDRKGSVQYISYVDESGAYVFSRIVPGDYTLRISDAAGQKIGERTVKATSATLMKVAFP